MRFELALFLLPLAQTRTKSASSGALWDYLTQTLTPTFMTAEDSTTGDGDGQRVTLKGCIKLVVEEMGFDPQTSTLDDFSSNYN